MYTLNGRFVCVGGGEQCIFNINYLSVHFSVCGFSVCGACAYINLRDMFCVCWEISIGKERNLLQAVSLTQSL